MTKAKELRDMSDEQLDLTAKEAVDKLFRARVQSQTERLDAPSELKGGGGEGLHEQHARAVQLEDGGQEGND